MHKALCPLSCCFLLAALPACQPSQGVQLPPAPQEARPAPTAPEALSCVQEQTYLEGELLSTRRVLKRGDWPESMEERTASGDFLLDCKEEALEQSGPWRLRTCQRGEGVDRWLISKELDELLGAPTPVHLKEGQAALASWGGRWPGGPSVQVRRDARGRATHFLLDCEGSLQGLYDKALGARFEVRLVYNERAQVTERQVILNHAGLVDTRERLSYDSQGRLAKISYFRRAQSSNILLGPELAFRCFPAVNHGRGLWTTPEDLSWRQEREVAWREMSYDAQGKLKEIRQEYKSNRVYPHRQEFSYDEEGFLIKHQTFFRNKQPYVEDRTYLYQRCEAPKETTH